MRNKLKPSLRKLLHNRGISSSHVKHPDAEIRATESKSSGYSRAGFFGSPTSFVGSIFPAMLLTMMYNALGDSEYNFKSSSGVKFQMIDTQSRNWQDFLVQNVLNVCNVSLVGTCSQSGEVIKKACEEFNSDIGWIANVLFKSCLDAVTNLSGAGATVDCISDKIDRECTSRSNHDFLYYGLPTVGGTLLLIVCAGICYAIKQPKESHSKDFQSLPEPTP